MRMIRIKAAVLLAGWLTVAAVEVWCFSSSDVSDESGVLMFVYCDGLDYIRIQTKE